MLSGRLAEIELVGKVAKKRGYFFVVDIDDQEMVKSETRDGVASLRWQEDYRLVFGPSSTIKIIFFRHSIFPLRRPYEIGQYSCDVIKLVEEENVTTFDLTDGSGNITLASLNFKLSLILDLAEDIQQGVGADLGRLNHSVLDSTSRHIDNAVAMAPCVKPLGQALQIFVNIMDKFADAHPIVKVSWTVLSAVYKTVKAQMLQDSVVLKLAERLQEMLGTAQKVPDLLVVENTMNVIEEISRSSLQIASLIHEYTRPSFIGRMARFQITDEMQSRIDDCLERCRVLMENFERRLAMETNQKVKEQHAVTLDVRDTLKTIKNEGLAKDIFNWLSAPDSSRNYNDACKKHEESTGSWFIDGKDFSQWKEDGGFLGIYGKAGCGKTVLCSSIITAVVQMCEENESTACAYFFFDARDAQSTLQRHDGFIRSLVQQLVDKCDGIPSMLAKLYGNGHQQPSTNALEDILEHILHGFAKSYIIIDSIDECAERKELLTWITKTASSKTRDLHILATSRPEEDIQARLRALSSITMEEGPVNDDIKSYIDSKMKEGKLSDWPEDVRLHIKETLLEKTQGMFRWLAIQLDELQKCLDTEEAYNQLERLPKDLDETYYRILARIPEQRRTAAKVFLQWTAFSARPLSLEELGEAAAFEFDQEGAPKYNPRRKLQPRDVLLACASLIIESEGYVKLSHFSVKEYLISERISRETVSHFGISERLSHSYISRTCLAYLLRFDSLESPSEDTLPDFPLAWYSAEEWVFHVRLEGNENSPVVQNLIMTLFTHEMSLTNWRRLYNPHDPRRGLKTFYSVTTVPNALYYASLLGLAEVVRGLLTKAPSSDTMHGWEIDSTGGSWGNALGAACRGGFMEIVKVLLDSGADVNANDGNALGNACRGGFMDIVKVLLDSGADVNAGILKALALASGRGRIDIVKVLLDSGADVNAGNHKALALASLGGHIDMIKVLLDSGADINANDSKALVNASWNGHIDIIHILLDRGADVNAGNGRALADASCEGHIDVVNTLLDRGADVNAGVGNVLALASFRGRMDIVNLLLDRGANVNAGDGRALAIASLGGHMDIVKVLLDRGADVNAGNGKPLAFVSLKGHLDVVQMLRDCGVDWKPWYGKPIEPPSPHSRKAITKLLLEHGAKASPDVPAS